MARERDTLSLEVVEGNRTHHGHRKAGDPLGADLERHRAVPVEGGDGAWESGDELFQGNRTSSPASPPSEEPRTAHFGGVADPVPATGGYAAPDQPESRADGQGFFHQVTRPFDFQHQVSLKHQAEESLRMSYRAAVA